MDVIKYRTSSDNPWQVLPAIKGEKGDPGEPGPAGKDGAPGAKGDVGIYIGETAPTDDSVLIWFNVDAAPIESAEEVGY
jgi:hypothetical protein